MAEVILEKLVKDYRDSKAKTNLRAVDSIDLHIEDGEFMVLVGPSGCGKSTTLRMIAGLEGITSGSIRIGDRVVNDVPPKNRDIAMVFQSYALYPHMTVYDNLAFSLKMRRWSKDQIHEGVMKAAKRLEIEPLLGRRPKALSGGQRQRVALGRAIVRQPQVFLFDEPLSNLDAKLRVTMRAEISRLHKSLGTTMIYVTHDQVEAMTLGDRITLMRDGVIQQTANPITLYKEPANQYVAGFIGSPPMNFLEGRIELDGGKPTFVETNGKRKALRVAVDNEMAKRLPAGAPVVLGIRPEHVRPANGASDPQAIEAAIELVETMGAETIVYLTTGQHGFSAKLPGSHRPEVGSGMRLLFPGESLHFFDKASGEAL